MFAGKNRWVAYNEKSGMEYDGSMVPAEWFGWLHYKTDFPPTEVSCTKLWEIGVPTRHSLIRQVAQGQVLSRVEVES